MAKEKQKTSKSNTLFDPDLIATAVNQALNRDFVGAQHVYALHDSITLYAFNRQVNELLKKFVPFTKGPLDLDALTYEKFSKVNYHIRTDREHFKFPSSNMRVDSKNSMDENIHLRARALMHSVLSDFSISEWFRECKNSQGSSIGVPYVDTSQEAKFTFPMTGTKDAISLFRQAMQYDNSLYCAIEKFNGDGPITGPLFEEVECSRATTVDKTARIKRFIAVEGTCNMFLQQGLMTMMYKRMARVGLNVAFLPDSHKNLAKESSITGSNATIDWSSASDCGSYELLKWLLPPKWFRYCDMTRTTRTQINEEVVDLHMFSTMGNAVTFPLETLVFWTYAHAVRLSFGTTNTLFPEWEDLMSVSVFGDDCIVPTFMASRYIETMKKVGFIVNDEKSYYGSEQFRESCGGDYLAGYDVRPYCITAPETAKRSRLEPWLYIITNSLLKKYIQYFGRTSYVYDKELWRCLFSMFRRHKIKIKLVPSNFPDDAGLKLSHDIERFCKHYRIQLNPIAKSRQGTVSFNYVRFIYTKRRERDDGIRYFLWLRKPIGCKERQIFEDENPHENDNPIVKDRLDRKRGGYVVAKGISCHWHVPVVKQALC